MMKQTQMYSIEDEQMGQLMGIIFACMAIGIAITVAFGIVTWILVFATRGV
jgi:hypothetical protein